MRIITGELKGRNFNTPSGNKTHPMSDKIKLALFNILGDVSDLTILDAYAGSGALSYEFISRGAKYVQAIDKDISAFQTMLENRTNLGISDSKLQISKANCSSWSDNNEDKKFDIVLIDPPFDKLNLSTIDKLMRHLKSTSIMIISHSGREEIPTVNGVVVVDNRTYGDAALTLYRLEQD